MSFDQRENEEVEMAEAATAAAGTVTDASSRSRAQQAAAVLTSAAVLGDLERKYVQVKQERDNLQKSMAVAEDQLLKMNESVAAKHSLELQVAESQHNLSLAQGRVKLLEEERKAVDERMDRLLAEADSLREEIR
jgi:DNA-directed RNA polymerase beta' subunit